MELCLLPSQQNKETTRNIYKKQTYTYIITMDYCKYVLCICLFHLKTGLWFTICKQNKPIPAVYAEQKSEQVFQKDNACCMFTS